MNRCSIIDVSALIGGVEMSKTVGYIRVSCKDQCLERQLAVLQALGIEEKYIYQDKQSGKDFDRYNYQKLKKKLKKDDLLIINLKLI